MKSIFCVLEHVDADGDVSKTNTTCIVQVLEIVEYVNYSQLDWHL